MPETLTPIMHFWFWHRPLSIRMWKYKNSEARSIPKKYIFSKYTKNIFAKVFQYIFTYIYFFINILFCPFLYILKNIFKKYKNIFCPSYISVQENTVIYIKIHLHTVRFTPCLHRMWATWLKWYNQWFCLHWMKHNVRDKSPTVNWCLVRFMMYWYKVQMIWNGRFVESCVDSI